METCLQEASRKKAALKTIRWDSGAEDNPMLYDLAILSVSQHKTHVCTDKGKDDGEREDKGECEGGSRGSRG